MIREATYEDYTDIKEIYKQRFTNNLATIDIIFNDIFPNSINYIYYIDGKSVSVASLIVVKNVINGKEYKGLLLVGVATLKEYEGNRYAKQIIKYLLENVCINYDAIFVQPANKSLITYYNKLGFDINVKPLKLNTITKFKNHNDLFVYIKNNYKDYIEIENQIIKITLFKTNKLSHNDNYILLAKTNNKEINISETLYSLRID